MGADSHIVKVAVPQAEPEWLNLEAGVVKTILLIEEASKNGAQLIAFSECWIPGYPDFLWGNNFKQNIPLVHKYHKNSMEVDSPEFMRIRNAARDGEIMVSLGFVERKGGSLYMAQTLIGPDGGILSHRHKTKPTHIERTLFGEGTGDSIRNVTATPLGNIGGLQCWEHLQPLLKYHTYSQNEQIHIAAWPTNHRYQGWEPWSFSTEAAVAATRMYAIESQAFVICATQTHASRPSDLSNEPAESSSEKSLEVLNSPSPPSTDDSHMAQTGGGFTAIYGPDGRKLTKDIASDWEGMIYADLDFDEIAFAKSVADPVGHYSRPDLFQLHVDTRRKEHVVYQGQNGGMREHKDMLHTFVDLDMRDGPTENPV